jgi:hypothetical protein
VSAGRHCKDMRLGSWSALLWAAIAIAVFLAMAILFFWAAVGFFVIVALALLNFVYLPRIAAFMRVDRTLIDALLLLLLALGGWAFGNGVNGAALGVLFWLGAVALPRLLVRRLGQRVHANWTVWSPHVSHSSSPLVGVTCPRCGIVSFAEPGAADRSCPSCSATLPRDPHGLPG